MGAGEQYAKRRIKALHLAILALEYTIAYEEQQLAEESGKEQLAGEKRKTTNRWIKYDNHADALGLSESESMQFERELSQVAQRFADKIRAIKRSGDE